MRTKDRAIFLRRALESVLSQSFSDWTLVLVNDGGSREDIEKTLQPFFPRFNGRLQLIHHEKAQSLDIATPLNVGIRASESELIAVHDDDDSWDTNFLSRTCEALKNKDIAGCVTKANLVWEKIEAGKIIETKRELYNPWLGSALSLFRLAEGNIFAPISLVFRRAVLSTIGYRRGDLGPLEDWEFNLRLLSHFPIPLIEDPLANYHQRVSESASGTNANFFRSHSDQYGYLDTKIRNELLRNDLASGRAGLGFLVNISAAHGRLFQKIER